MRFCAQTTLCLLSTTLRAERDITDLCSQGMCLLMILMADKGSGIVQLRYRKRERAVSFDVTRGGGGGGGSREKRTFDVSCGQNRYARLP